MRTLLSSSHVLILIMSYSCAMSIWVSTSSSNRVTRTQNGLLVVSYSLWVTHTLWAYGWATLRLTELLALKMGCSLWATHTWVAHHGLLVISYSYMSCSLWVTHILWANGWEPHRLAELLPLKMLCSLWVTHTLWAYGRANQHALLIMSYSYESCSL